MKKVIVLVSCLLLGISMWGQTNKTVPSYSEQFEEASGKLRAKEWVSANKSRVIAYDDLGNYTLMIYRADSAKIYTQNSTTKKWLSFPISQIKNGTFMGGQLNIVNHSSDRTFIEMEKVGGLDCMHYSVTSETGHQGGTTSYASWDEWVYEPYNMVIRRSDDTNPGGYLIRRNIQVGEPDPSLFELPDDYYGGNDIPLNGLLELLTGDKSGNGNAGSISEDKREKLNSFMQQFEKAKNK